jgi:SpoVG
LDLRRGEAVAWGARQGANLAEPRRRAKLRKWTARHSGALLGFCSVELASGMVINDLKVLTGKNGPWVAMPSQKQLDRGGNPRLDADGKPVFNQVIEFRSRQIQRACTGAGPCRASHRARD